MSAAAERRVGLALSLIAMGVLAGILGRNARGRSVSGAPTWRHEPSDAREAGLRADSDGRSPVPPA
jgi:hypothetical protein